MPILTVKGMPTQTPQLELLLFRLADAAAGIKELALTRNQVSVFFPLDMVREGIGEELIAFVDGLFKKPERTPEVLKRLAESIRDVLADFAQRHVPQCRLIEVLVHSFDPTVEGFASREIGKQQTS